MKHKLVEKNIRIIFTCLILILLSTIIVGPIALASENTSSKVDINNNTEEYDLTKDLVIFQDTKKEYDINSILYTEVSDRFKSYSESKLSGEISNSAYWAKVVVQNNEDEALDMCLEISKPQLSNLKFYRLDGINLVEEVETGSDYPFYKRAVNNRNFVFNLHLNSKEVQTIILRVEAKSFLQLPIKLYTYKYFIEKEEHSIIILGIYYGIMLIMILYNLILYFSLKDKSYIYYCSFIFSFSVMQLIWDGLAFQYLWPDLVFWNSKSNPFFINLTGVFLIQFTRVFLRIRDKAKYLNKLMLVILSLDSIALMLVIFIPLEIATKISVILITLSSIICILSPKFVRDKGRPLRLYIISWIALFLGTFLNLLAAYKLLPLNFITLYSPRIGSVINTVLLSLSLGDRFNLMRQEKIIEERQRILLENLHNITKTITSTSNISVMVTFLLQSICNITKFKNGMIVLNEERDFIIKAVFGYNSDKLKNRVVIDLEEDIYFKKMMDESKPIILTNVEMHSYGIEKSFKTFVGFPIAYHEKNVGMILLYCDTIEISNTIQYDVLYDFTGQVGIAIENARLFNKIEKMAIIDGLTGIFNRTHFLKLTEYSIEEHQNSNKPLSLIMLDIDYFKKINDTYGHLIGDEVLQNLVRMLKMEINEDCIIGRYGGEEFLILVKNSNLEIALNIAENLRRKTENMKVNIGKDSFLKFTISIGVAQADDFNYNVSQLIGSADKALYVSKERGRNQVNTLQILV